jgi:enoyl-CoA hydratase/carnithine racemase
MADAIVVERDQGVGLITLNRPKVLNAMNRVMGREINDAINDFQVDSEVGAIVLTGAGERAFSSGADIHEMARLAKESESRGTDPRRAEYSWNLATCNKPTIGAINGLAYGGGAVLAASLDIRVGCDRSSFRFLAASYGRVNSTWNLPLQIGWPIAKELLFTGRILGGEEAYRIGFLNHLVALDEVVPKALEIARQIVANDARMVQGIKELIINDVGLGWKAMHENEVEAQSGKLSPTPISEGFKTFLDRKPKS